MDLWLSDHTHPFLLCLVILKQDKNRDIIVAFPDVDPSFISLRHASVHQRDHRNSKPISRRAFLKETTDDSYDHPHLWYSTSEVVRALELFIKSGNELSGSNTYRLVSNLWKDTLAAPLFHRLSYDYWTTTVTTSIVAHVSLVSICFFFIVKFI